MEIHTKLLAIMRDCASIGKAQKNQQQNYQFRGIDDVANELHDHFVKHGVFILPEVIDCSQVERQTKSGGALFYTTLRMRYTFMCEDGTSVSVTTSGEAMDSGDKSTNKAMSAALKYALLQMFLIPTADKKDSENDTYEVAAKTKSPSPEQESPTISAAQDAEIRKLLESPDLADAVKNTVLQKMGAFSNSEAAAAISKLKKMIAK